MLDNSGGTGRPRLTGGWSEWAANNLELAYVLFYGLWPNRIAAQFTALRYFALDGTDHESPREQASIIRRYIASRNRHITDPKLRKVIRRAEIIKRRTLPDPHVGRESVWGSRTADREGVTQTTGGVAVNADAAEDIAATGLAEIQLIFDASMARFALLLEVWLQVSRETLEPEQSSSVGALGAADPVASPVAA